MAGLDRLAVPNAAFAAEKAGRTAVDFDGIFARVAVLGERASGTAGRAGAAGRARAAGRAGAAGRARAARCAGTTCDVGAARRRAAPSRAARSARAAALGSINVARTRRLTAARLWHDAERREE